MVVPNGARARRQSILEADIAPSALLANGDLSGAPPGRPRARTTSTTGTGVENGNMVNGANNNVNGQETESQNARALEVLDRVQQKLTGRDFKPEEELDVVNQVNKLIVEATRLENLCQHYIGWCSFW